MEDNSTYYFARPTVKPLSRRVSGIEGQTNTLLNPPLHVGHGDAIVSISRALGATLDRCGVSTVEESPF